MATVVVTLLKSLTGKADDVLLTESTDGADNDDDVIVGPEAFTLLGASVMTDDVFVS